MQAAVSVGVGVNAANGAALAGVPQVDFVSAGFHAAQGDADIGKRCAVGTQARSITLRIAAQEVRQLPACHYDTRN